MKFKSLLIFLFICPHFFSYGQATCALSSFKKLYYQYDSVLYPENSLDHITSLNNNAYFIGGTSVTTADENGSEIWDSTYNKYYQQDGLPYISQTGDYYILLGNYRLLNIDPNDNILWTKYLVDTSCYCNSARHITQTSDGGFIITGSKNIIDTSFFRNRIFVVKTDLNGDTLWTRIIAKSPFENEGYYAQETSDGGFLVIANIEFQTPALDYKIGIIKLNSLGQEQWFSTVATSIFAQTPIKAIKTIDNKCAIVAPYNGFYASTLFAKIDESGTEIFDTVYNDKKFDSGFTQLTNGNYVIGMKDSMFVIHENSNAILSVHAYKGLVDEIVPLNSIQQTCDGGLIIAANSAILRASTICCGSNFDFYHFYSYMIKTDSTFADIATVSGISEGEKADKVDVYPNPFSDYTLIHFERKMQHATICIYDVLGKEVKRVPFSGNEFVLKKEDILPGIYFIQVNSSDSFACRAIKIIVQ